MSTVNAPPFTPPPSIGHEIGIMFGFGGLMVLCMVTYGFIWRAGQKRSALKERERCAALAREWDEKVDRTSEHAESPRIV